MSATARPHAGLWHSARRLLARTPMRVKLITAVLALVAIALATISVAGLAFLRTYLFDQANQQLASYVDQAPRDVQRFLFGTQYYSPNVVMGWKPDGGGVQWAVKEVSGLALNPPSNAPGQPGQVMPGPTITQGASWLSGHQIATVNATSGNGRFRVFALPNQSPDGANGPTGTIIVGVDVTSAYQTLNRLTGIDIIISSILLAGIGVIGVTVIRASLRPFSDIEKTADAIADGDLSRRVPDLDPQTEVGRLGRSLNTMLAHIETAFEARSASEAAARKSEDKMRQFVGDASHELRTPLTAIRGFAEYYRQRGGVDTTAPAQPGASAARIPLPLVPPAAGGAAAAGAAGAAGGAGAAERPPGKLAPAELDRIMRRVEQESSRMGVLVEDMLLLARLDQQRPLEHRTVDLLSLAADAVHDARVVAPDRNINLTVGAGAALLVLGDEVRLRQVIGNLMSNAMAHTPGGTPIEVLVRSGSLDEARSPGPFMSRPESSPPPPEPRPGPPPAAAPAPGEPGQPGPPAPPDAARARSAAVLEVTDHGPGLTREQAQRAFERFYRADQARTSGGTGLGLAIVAALVAAHHGAVWVESQPGAGATFRIALPLAPEAMHDDADFAGEDDALARRRP
jgi:two-component system OmpR family sensor kinase